MPNVGKLFETEIRKFLETKYFAIRLPDILIQAPDRKVTTRKPFDFCGCDLEGRFIAVECKATRADTFSFSRIEDHQAEALGWVADTENGKAYLALNFRNVNSPGHAWLISWKWWLDWESCWPKKSINKSEALEEFWKFELDRISGSWEMPNVHEPRMKLT